MGDQSYRRRAAAMRSSHDFPVRVFVAGITFSKKYESKSTAQKTRKLIRIFKEVISDAEKVNGPNGLVIAVLHEYAFTPSAVDVAEKDSSIQLLREIVKLYPNLVLIPGSYAATQKLHDTEKGNKKQNKITQNYSRLFNKAEYALDQHFMDEYQAYMDYLDAGEIDQKIVLQNSSYILTSAMKHKYSKSFPFDERDKLNGKHKGVFALGGISPVKTVQAADIEFDMGVVICREHVSASHSKELAKKPPFIQVIISDSIEIDSSHLYGALNIHMDSFTGLTLYCNMEHSAVEHLEKIKATEYFLDAKSNLKALGVTLTDFNRRLTGAAPKRAATVIMPVADAQAPSDDDLDYEHCTIN